MITKTLKTLTGKLEVSIPERLQELKLGQLMAMQATTNMTDLQAIHILSGVPLASLQQVQHYTELDVFNQQVLALATQIKELYNSNIVPKAVTFHVNSKAVKVNVIKNLSVEPAGAFLAARDIIAEEITKHVDLHGADDWRESFNPSLQTCSQVLAHYFYTRATSLPYDEELATDFTAQVELLPVTEALPIAKCFFLSYPNLSKPKTRFWHHLFRRLSNGLALPNFKNSGTSTPLTHLPGAI